jgi:hypothetical protein
MRNAKPLVQGNLRQIMIWLVVLWWRLKMAAYRRREIELTGTVLAADVKTRSCQLWLNSRSRISVEFKRSHEREITGALMNHKYVRLRVKGRGKYSSRGKLEGIVCGTVECVEERKNGVDPSDLPLEERLIAISAKIPDAEWKKLPADANKNLDHYLYGAPKR